jgi:uncharacterized protein with FMN-binding domain
MSDDIEKDAKRSSGRVTNNVVSASCAAVLAVYIAGYARTQSAASRFTAQIAERRVAPHSLPAAPVRTEFRAPALPMPAAISPERARVAAPVPVTVAHAPSATALPAANGAEIAPSPLPAEPPAQSPPVTTALEPSPVITQAAEPTPPAAEQKPEAPPAAPSAPLWKDGTYTGWGYSRHGDIEATVVIEGGRIASAVISQCRTRYSCSVIDRLPPQVAQRQSPDVDYVSGATQSADAFYGAVVEALKKAK